MNRRCYHGRKGKNKLTVKGILKALLIVLLILVIISLIIIWGGKSNKKDNTIIQGDSGNVYGNTEYVARLFQQTTGADL